MRFFEPVKENHKRITANCILPRRATANSAAYDFFAPITVNIPPFTVVDVWTNIKAKFNADEALLINVRSSMGKHPLMLANTQGWIDSDYYCNPENDGNICIKLFNLSNQTVTIDEGHRFAQGMFIKFLITSNDNAKGQRRGGFGSTNKQ